MINIFIDMCVGDVVLITGMGGRVPYYDTITRVGNTFIEVGREKYDNKDGHLIGVYKQFSDLMKFIVCKKDYIDKIKGI